MKQELIKSTEFVTALEEGAEYKKNIVTTYKTQNKLNFKRFQEVMFESSPEIKKILETRKKNRSDDDNKKLKDFKTTVSQLYRQTTDLIIKENLEDNKKSKIQKIIDKIVPVIFMLRYIDQDAISIALENYGLKIISNETLETKYPGLNSKDKQNIIKDIFNVSKTIKENINSDNQYISENIFQTKVPVEIQFNKHTNNIGLKVGDFNKLVSIKTKLLMAKTEDAKVKVDEKIENLAVEKQYEASRAETVRNTLIKLI